mmetsp:Transcript_29356/g.80508  ORF Transcript_29356/g.80508 Transcript_29356/m.80508 type:complete len:420 (-) Transcript_29356:502-1761(-)
MLLEHTRGSHQEQHLLVAQLRAHLDLRSILHRAVKLKARLHGEQTLEQSLPVSLNRHQAHLRRCLGVVGAVEIGHSRRLALRLRKVLRVERDHIVSDREQAPSGDGGVEQGGLSIVGDELGELLDVAQRVDESQALRLPPSRWWALRLWQWLHQGGVQHQKQLVATRGDRPVRIAVRRARTPTALAVALAVRGAHGRGEGDDRLLEVGGGHLAEVEALRWTKGLPEELQPLEVDGSTVLRAASSPALPPPVGVALRVGVAALLQTALHACVALAPVGHVGPQQHEQFVDHVPVLLLGRLLDGTLRIDHLGEHLDKQHPALGVLLVEQAAILGGLRHLRGGVVLHEHGAHVLDERIERHAVRRVGGLREAREVRDRDAVLLEGDARVATEEQQHLHLVLLALLPRLLQQLLHQREGHIGI